MPLISLKKSKNTKNKGVIIMNNFNKITVCVEGKNIKVEVGSYELKTLIIKRLNGMAAFK